MGGLLYGPQYDMRDFGGRTITIEKQVVNQPWEPFYDTNYAIGETMTIEVEEDVADGVPDNPGDIIWQASSHRYEVKQ